MLEPAEERAFVDAIDITMLAYLRDRILIEFIFNSFPQFDEPSVWRLRNVHATRPPMGPAPREGRQAHAMQRHHNLETYLTGYIDGASVAHYLKVPFFRKIGRGARRLARAPLSQANAYMMIGQRAAAAVIGTKPGNQTFGPPGSPPSQKWRHVREGGCPGELRSDVDNAAL